MNARASSKVLTKGAPATSAAPTAATAAPTSTADLDAWVKDVVTDKGCNTCAHRAASETLSQLLRAMARNRAYSVPLRDIHKKLKEMHSDYTIGFWGFRAHLYECTEKLYKKARGKDHA